MYASRSAPQPECAAGSGGHCTGVVVPAVTDSDSDTSSPCIPSPTLLSLIVPVYCNADTIPQLITRLDALSTRLKHELEVVFVIDGSPDHSYELIHSAMPGSLFMSQVIRLSRNFGSFAAIRAGLEAAQGPLFAVMAADLQEPVELIDEFLHHLSSRDCDLVVGVRSARADPFTTKVFSGLYWRFYRRLVQPEMPPGGMDVFGCNRQVRDALLGLNESNSSLVGQLVWLGFRRREVEYSRLSREVGKSGWTFRKKVSYMLDSVFSFTHRPILLLMLIGVVGGGSSIVAACVVFIAWLYGHITVPGYTPVVLAILFSMFTQMVGTGVVGIYVWRAFENTKNRPPSISMTTERYPGSALD